MRLFLSHALRCKKLTSVCGRNSLHAFFHSTYTFCKCCFAKTGRDPAMANKSGCVLRAMQSVLRAMQSVLRAMQSVLRAMQSVLRAMQSVSCTSRPYFLLHHTGRSPFSRDKISAFLWLAPIFTDKKIFYFD